MTRVTFQSSATIRLLAFVCLIATLFVMTGPVWAGVFTVLEDNASETVVELSFPEWEQRQFEDGTLYLPVSAAVDSRVGMRMTPYVSRLVALPSASLPQIVIEEQRWGDKLEGVAPYGDAAADNLPVSRLQGRGPVVLGEPYTWRHRNVAHVFVVPVRETDNGVVPLEYIRFRIIHNRPQAGLRSESDRLVELGVLNGATARGWALPKKRSNTRSIASAFAWPDGQLIRIEIEQEGMYQLSGATLKARGIDVAGYDPRKFRMYHNGGQRLPIVFNSPRPDSLIENAIHITGQNDGSFDDSDRIIFYGRSVNTWVAGATPGSYVHTMNPFTRRNVYWLQISNSGDDGKRMNDLEADAAVTYEAETARSRVFVDTEAVVYGSKNHPESGVLWYAKELNAGEAYSVSFEADHPLEAADASIWVMFENVGVFSEKAVVQVNSTVIDTIELDDERRHLSIPDGVLRDGSNNFSFRLIGGHVYFNAIEVDYLRSLESDNGKIAFDALPQDGIARVTFDGMDNPWLFDIQDYPNVTYTRGEALSINSSVSSPHKHLAVEDSQILSPASIQEAGFGSPDYPNGLRDPSLAPNTIYIYHSDFTDAVRQLETYVENRDGREVLSVDIEDVYQEFAWGLYDPVAIRDFLMYAYENYAVTPGTVLLVGDGDYDYRNIVSDADNNWIPPYEDGILCRDLWYTQFAADDVIQTQMVMGRLPVQTNEELEIYLDKLQRYENDSDLGAWRSKLVMVADDEYVDTGPSIQEQIHMEDAEEFANEAAPDFITVKKIYIGTYPTTFDPGTGGRRKPAATAALLNEINRGALMVSFIGHGNAHVWTHESVLLDTRDTQLIDSGDRTPLFLAATCSWGHFDRPENEAHPEQLLVNPGGAIGVVAASRVTNAYANNRFALAFYERVFDREAALSAAEALYLALIDHPESTNQYYHYFGEPDMKLALPALDVNMTSINPDSLTALQNAQVTAEVLAPDGSALPDFNGESVVTVYDSADTLDYVFVDSNGNPVDTLQYYVAGGTLFRGLVSATEGALAAEFIVPRDVKYGSQNGSVHMYAYNDDGDGVGSTAGVKISTQSASSNDNTPPDVTVYFDHPNWREGDLTSASPTLYVQLFDSSGINLTGEIGHDIRAVIDGTDEVLLTETFTYERDSYTAGIATEQLFSIEPGEHQLEVWAWDNANNFSRAETKFVVVDADQEVALNNVLNWPNPFEQRTNFTFELSTDAEVTIKIYTASGRKIREIGPIQAQAGFNYPADGASQALEWDGRDDYGDPVANGAYLYVVEATSASGQSDEVVGKLLRIR